MDWTAVLLGNKWARDRYKDIRLISHFRYWAAVLLGLAFQHWAPSNIGKMATLQHRRSGVSSVERVSEALTVSGCVCRHSGLLYFTTAS